MSYFKQISVDTNNGTGDAFGRLRVSNPVTLFDSKQIFDNQPLFWDDQEVSGTGTSTTYSQNNARTRIGVSNTTAGKRVRQTFMRFNYQPGKSQLVLLTTVLSSAGAAGISAAVGQFDNNNGLFMQIDGTTVYAVRRTNVTGTPTDNRVAQSSWNIDTMDGTGKSGITIDPTKTQIIVIDYEWLGVGRVRMGFNIDGVTYYVHEFKNANNLTEVYMSTPNLPLRYEIENDGTGPATTLDHICTSIVSEGGQSKLGVLRHKDSSALTGLSSGTVYAFIGLKLQPTKLGGSVELENVSALATSPNDTAHWSVRINPTVAGTFTYGNETNSVVMSAVGTSANTVTGGTEVDGGYFSTSQAAVTAINNALRIGANIAGTADTIVLCVRPITNNIGVEASMTWRELS